MLYYIRKKMLEVVLHAYPDFYDKYKNFYLECSYKEVKKNSKYYFEQKKVTINNLAGEPGHVFISALVALTEHIDIINRKETHPDRDFFMILRKLLSVSLKRNIIIIDDLKTYSDDKMRNRLQKEFSSFSNWTEKVDQNLKITYVYINVYDSFMIKTILKNNSYMYDKEQACWTKELLYDEMKDEEAFIEEYKNKATFQIVADNSFLIRPVYLMKLKTYSKEDAPLLRALEYQYDRTKNLWQKIVLASELEQEYKNIKNIPKQNVAISSNT